MTRNLPDTIQADMGLLLQIEGIQEAVARTEEHCSRDRAIRNYSRSSEKVIEEKGYIEDSQQAPAW